MLNDGLYIHCDALMLACQHTLAIAIWCVAENSR